MTFVDMFLYILILIVWLRFLNHLLNYYLLTYLTQFSTLQYCTIYAVQTRTAHCLHCIIDKDVMFCGFVCRTYSSAQAGLSVSSTVAD